MLWGRSGGLQGTTVKSVSLISHEGERLRAYLVHYVLQRVWAVDGKANEDQVGVWVREWAQPIIFLLPGSIPQRQLHGLSTGLVLCVCNVVLKDRGNVFLGKVPLAVADQQASLTAAAIAHNDEFLRVRWGLRDIRA